ncbi:2Fe-2S iron-sulfur cluster binding domain-containing protein [Geobacter sp. FeAm09]|uniref:2Fe-2S iron-sulfur cluster-binding protein n=1 Tax=Geobacter sp. FeAm09 TaxID=2597769 RepID=UPI0011ED1969|nr:2Fe-2S iron-sulfur cluster-binding protein [Geobacter sp. FeAm09]QEM68762.1 2Fe-2S iron-sulfur cluster binding domain-containing protein [Geobacter sp. FeAm09]
MNLKISKYDPSVDSAAKLITVSVTYTDKMTVLEAIQFAHETTPIAFDYSCRGRACGRCAVMLDGKPVLACITPITNATHTIEPLTGQPVIRDLIVDKREAHNSITARYRRTRSTSMTDVEFNTTYDTNVIDQINAIEWCTRCTVCTAGCPAYKANPSTFVGPAEMLAIAYRFYDPYDEGNRVVDAVQAGLWNCIMCGQCDNLCPQKEIKRVTQIWKDLRAAATAAGYPNPNA